MSCHLLLALSLSVVPALAQSSPAGKQGNGQQQAGASAPVEMFQGDLRASTTANREWLYVTVGELADKPLKVAIAVQMDPANAVAVNAGGLGRLAVNEHAVTLLFDDGRAWFARIEDKYSGDIPKKSVVIPTVGIARYGVTGDNAPKLHEQFVAVRTANDCVRVK